MLTIEEIKKELDAGNTVELECVDFNGYKNKCDNYDADYIDTNNITVKTAESDSKTIHTNNGVIYLDSLKYFHIKRHAPTFNDLIDVAVQAQKDGLLSRVEIKENSLNGTAKLTDTKMLEFCIGKDAGHIVTKERIDFIKSLYTETFVIESLADVEKIKLKAKFYQNGFEYEIDQSRLNSLQDCKLFMLKGATVTQKRGAV